MIENLDGIFDDFESKDVERHVGVTSDTDEYVFYHPDRPEEHRHQDIGSDLRITAKYDIAVDF